MSFATAYHEDSDADDELYDDHIMTSERNPPSDSEASPTDSDPNSTEHTPRLYGHFGDDRSPGNLIVDWSAEETAVYIETLGLGEYYDAILDNEIVGEALVALRHEELKEMGMSSMGHRLTVLKGVYDIKIQQGIPIEPEHYLPPSVALSKEDSLATQDDVARIVQSIKLRDERIIESEKELRKITDEHRKLREELLPIFRSFKDKSQPLPFHPGGDMQGYDQENKSPRENMPLDPSAAAMAASTHLTASMNGGALNSPSASQQGMPSPTSPLHTHQSSSIAGRGYRNDQPSSGGRSGFPQDTPPLQHASYTSNATTLLDQDRAASTSGPSGRRHDNMQQQEPPLSGGGGPNSRGAAPQGGGDSAPSVEIFKSFRVSLEDPCYKVLPAALKKYNINADWKQYALYIVHGDQERCLGLQEKPLILFKQLDKEGRKPMFMLRRHAAPAEGHSGIYNPDGGQGSVVTPMPRSQNAYQNGIQLPGGVL